ncbi:MAG: helix-hairpin-helix domain-containing protein [Candidatus Thorarchaeota archaeon]
MAKKKLPDKAVQTTLGDVMNESSPKKKASPKKEKVTGQKAPTKKSTSKKRSSKKKTGKEPLAKKPVKKAKDSTKKKKDDTSSKKQAVKKESPAPEPEGTSPMTLPGVGAKLAERLISAGYGSVEKISRARADSLSKKVEGLSKSGAERLVLDAKKLLKPPSEQAPEDQVVSGGEEEESTRPALTEIPGVGSKLAMTLDSAGYNSIARLSRASPSGIAARIEGLGLDKATRIVAAARDYMKAYELRTVAGEPETISVKSTKAPKSKEKEKKLPLGEEPTIDEDEALVEPIEEQAEKPSTKPKRTTKKKQEEVVVSKRKKVHTPVRKKPKVLRKESGLPVPRAVQKLAKEMRLQWAEVDRMEQAGELPTDLPETVEVVNLESKDTTDRLVSTAADVLNETLMTGRPAFEIPSRSSDNIVWDEFRDLLLLGMKTVSRPYHSLASVVDATRTARVMEIIYQLLRSNLHASKREVFYSDVNLFRDQKYSDKIIEDVSSMLNTTRDSVHVVASARGSAMGRVVIRDGGDTIDLTKMGTGGWAVTPFLDQLEILESDAEFILVSEKDAAVMRLSEAKYWNRQPCIVITGKGSGDIATRAFLKMLVKELEIPAFALVDSDPYGHYIYSVFLRGSKRLSYESPFIATPELKLLGVLSRDLDAFDIPKSVRIPMEPADIKRVREMLKEPFVQKNKEWVEDLQLMLRLKEKAEIQAFASHSFEYLTDVYLPRKLETGDWI